MGDPTPGSPEAVTRYGNRTIRSMQKRWNALREAVSAGDPIAIQEAFDACEEWIDFAFASASNPAKPPHVSTREAGPTNTVGKEYGGEG